MFMFMDGKYRKTSKIGKTSKTSKTSETSEYYQFLNINNFIQTHKQIMTNSQNAKQNKKLTKTNKTVTIIFFFLLKIYTG